jgi:predicted aspartyl protease
LLFASPTRVDRIGRVVAPVTIDGKGPFRFIIDTGASDSTISPQLALTLGLRSDPEVTVIVHGVTGTATVASVPIDRLQAGDLVIADARFPVIWAPLMAGADGILGIAGQRSHCVFVDFRHNRVEISHTLRRIDRAGFNKIRARALDGGLIAVDAKIASIAVQAVVDTGSERTMGNMALYHALAAKRSLLVPVATTVYGATTTTALGEILAVPGIDLGNLQLQNVAAVFGDFHIFKVWNMQDRPALIIGMDVLGTLGAFGIDFRRAELYVQGVRLETRLGR